MPSTPDKISSFHGNNAIGAREHWDLFMEYIIDTGICHLDVLLICFALSSKGMLENGFNLCLTIA
jgi:hypothetical protein